MQRKIISRIFILILFYCSHNCSVEEDINEKATPAKNVVIGLVNATAENTVTQPLDIIKNYGQQKHGFKLTRLGFRDFYRGFGANTCSYAPTVGVQTAAHGVAQDYVNPFISSFSAGLCSAFITAPTESIVIHQQNTGLKVSDVLRKLKEDRHMFKLFRGLTPTMARESSFAAGYLVCVERVKKIIQQQTGVENRIALTFLGGLPVGLTAAAMTQPADTIKTIMQGNYKSNTTVMQECKKLLKESGVSGFYRGFYARATIVAISITLLNEFNILLHKLLK